LSKSGKAFHGVAAAGREWTLGPIFSVVPPMCSTLVLQPEPRGTPFQRRVSESLREQERAGRVMARTQKANP
jgi:hypothetical protein